MVHWPDDDRKPNIAEMIKEHKFDLVINVPKNLSKTELDKDYVIRRMAIDFNIPLLTNARLAAAFIRAFLRYGVDDLNIKAWNEY